MSQTFPLDIDALLRVLNYLNLGVYVTDLDRRIMLWNKKAEEITGYVASNVVGHCCRDNILCHTDKDGQVLCPTHLCPLYRAMISGHESKEPVLVFAKKAAGGRVALTVSVAPLKDESGAIVGGIEVFRDETERIHDLEFAQKIQRHLLPRRLPSTGKLRFDARYYPHDLVGGDFYDVTDLGGGRFGVLVADVRGHGVSASLYTMVLKTIKESLASRAGEPAQFLAGLNRELSHLVVSESFATAAYAVVDTASWQVAYSSAGQPPALHYRAAERSASEVLAEGLPLGIDSNEEYEVAEFHLEPGDLALYFTDGITDIRDRSGKAISAAGLAELLSDEMARPGEDLLERVYRRAVAANADISISDDVLLLSIERTK